MKYGYQCEKLAAARTSLMLPHPRGEAQSIASAFHMIFNGLDGLKNEDLDDDARRWVVQLTELMDTTGIEGPAGRGTWLIKAERLTEEQRFELSRAVDELAHWFYRYSREGC